MFSNFVCTYCTKKNHFLKDNPLNFLLKYFLHIIVQLNKLCGSISFPLMNLRSDFSVQKQLYSLKEKMVW